MQYHIEKEQAYSLASITRPDEQMVLIEMTADIHEENSAHLQAVSEVYAEAIVSGCKAYDREAFHEAMSMLGASMAVDVSNGEWNITIRTIAKNVENVLRIFTCMMESPTFATKEFKRIHTLCINALHDKKDEADVLAEEQFVNRLYDSADRKYSFDADALVAEVPTVSSPDLRQLHARVMQSYWYCSIAGNEAVVRRLKQTIHALKKKASVRSPGSHSQKQARAAIVLQDVPSKQNIEFSLGAPLPFTLHHPDLLPFVFGLNVLGKWGGFTGRLMSTVREKEGLTYGIYATTEGIRGNEQGYWRIMTFFAPKHAEQGLRSTLREIKAIHEAGITNEEFKRFRTILETQQNLLKDSLLRSLKDLHRFHTAAFTLHEMEAHKKRLLSVTKKEVDAALSMYLDPRTLIISGAGPVKNVRKALQKFAREK